MHLQIEQDLGFQHRSWRWQRAGWAAMAVLEVVALLGGTGGGPLQRGVERSGAAIIRFDRVARRGAISSMLIEAPARAGELSIDLLRAVAGTEVVAVDPPPLRTELHQGGARLLFAVEGPGPVEVRLDFRHRSSGWLEASIAVNEGPAAPWRQLVAP